MYNPNDEGPVSPLKKLKILSEKQNVQVKKIENSALESIKENMIEPKKETTMVEPLLQESSGQYVIFPINHQDMWVMYKELVGNFWSVTENTENIQKLETLKFDYNETMFLKYFSSIFASPQSRGLVNDNFAEEFCKIIQVTEAKFFYGHQLFVQNIHYEMYNKLMDSFIPTYEEKEKFFKIVENYEAVANKRKWVASWKDTSFAEQLVASACLHGLLFTSLNLVNNWLKQRIRNGVTHEIFEVFDKMIIDQELQRDFSILMVNNLRNKPSKEKIIETINQAAKIEFDFLLNGIKVDLINVDSNEVIELIDKKTTTLKKQFFKLYDEKKKMNNNDSENYNTSENSKVKNENHQKLVFDEDF